MQYLVLFIVADDNKCIFLSFLERNDLVSNFKSNKIKSKQIRSRSRTKFKKIKLTSSAPLNTFHRFCNNVLQINRKLSVEQSKPIVSNQILPPTMPPTINNVTNEPSLLYNDGFDFDFDDDVVVVVADVVLVVVVASLKSSPPPSIAVVVLATKLSNGRNKIQTQHAM